MKTPLITPSQIRNQLVECLVPAFERNLSIYKDMQVVVKETNQQELEAHPEKRDFIDSLGKIMHGAVRFANDNELYQFGRIMNVMGCLPVNYYDLRKNVSVGGSGLRPIEIEDLRENGFRIFTSFFDIETVPSEHKAWIEGLISERDIFSAPLLELLDIHDHQNGFTSDEVESFIDEVLKLFIRPKEAAISLDSYTKLLEINKTAAHMLVSNAFALNHLTPCVANVHAAHRKMQEKGIKTIPVVQGPPEGLRILLNQTSCTAPPVELLFPKDDGSGFEAGLHQESFVEMEQRHIALTPKGRKMYDDMLKVADDMTTLSPHDADYADMYSACLEKAFADFPRDYDTMREEKLAYFTYESTGRILTKPYDKHQKFLSFRELVNVSYIKAIPQLYEDFLPKSAQGIFRANLGQGQIGTGIVSFGGQKMFEKAIQTEIIDMYDLYEKRQTDSLKVLEKQFKRKFL